MREVHQKTEGWHWSLLNETRMGRYLTARELEYIGVGLSAVTSGRALDVGCGTGRLSASLTDMGFDIVGLDADPEVLQSILGQSADTLLVHADAQRLPFRDACFSCAVCVQVLGYLADRCAFFCEAYRVLQPDGLLLVSLTNKRSIKGAMYGPYLCVVGRERQHLYDMDHRSGLAQITAAGFQIVRAWGFNWNLLPRDSNSILVDMCAMLERTFHLEKLLFLSPAIFVVARKVGRCES